MHRPPALQHPGDKLLAARGDRDGFQKSDGAVRDKALFAIVDQQVIFVLAPGADLALLNSSAVKVAAFFRNGQPPATANVIGKMFLFLQVSFCLVELPAVKIGDAVGYNMAMHMLLVLMYADKVLEAREEFFGKCLSDLQHLPWRNRLVLVEADDVVRVHPPGVFLPEPLFSKPGPVERVIIDRFPGERSGDLDVALLDFFIAQDIFKDVPHCPVAFG